MQSWLSCRHGEDSRSGGPFHWKGRLLLIDPRGGGTPHHAGPTVQHQGGAQAERMRGDMGQSLHWGCHERQQVGQVRDVGLASEWLQWVLGTGLSLVTWGDGRWIVAWCVGGMMERELWSGGLHAVSFVDSRNWPS
jgi:hypothetical protein